MRGRLNNDVDPPVEQHQLADGSEEWVAPGVEIDVVWQRPAPKVTHVRLRIESAKAIVEDNGPEHGETNFVRDITCSACGGYEYTDDPDDELEHAADCWWIEISEALGVEP